MPENLNGVHHMGEDDREPKEIALEALNTANDAKRRAHLASEHAVAAHENIGMVAGEMGRLSGAVDALKMAMIDGFKDFGVKLNVTHGVAKKAKATAEDLADEQEITKVRDLRKELRVHKARWKWILGVLSTVLAAVIVAFIVHALWH